MRVIGDSREKSVSLAFVPPSLVPAGFRPAFNYIRVVAQVRISRELSIDCCLQPGRVKEFLEIVRVHFLCKVEVWKFMPPGLYRDHRFERALHYVAG